MKKLRLLLIVLIIAVACKGPSKEAAIGNESVIPEFTKADVNLSAGTLMRVDSFPSKYVRPRNVDVWLPEGYNEDEKYAVLYMHDGQMLFDSTTTWNGQEWKVDEIMNQLHVEGKIRKTLVVAMWNHSDIRSDEYFPNKPYQQLAIEFRDSIIGVFQKNNPSYFSKGVRSDDYLKFIVEEVKPIIDARFSTHTAKEHTMIAGSSMGGLISMYALCEYPEIFGGAACLSTHWPGMMPMPNNPIPATFFNYLETALPNPNNHKLYFDYGTATLDAYYIPYQSRVDEVLQQKGYTDQNYLNLGFEGHDHSENSWNKRFQVPVEFLLAKDQ